MEIPHSNAEAAVRFGVVAQNFCSLVDSGSDIDRSEFVAQVYRILPKLINGAIEMPVVQSDNQQRRSPSDVRHHEWERLYNGLKEKLGDWDQYRQVFDPTRESDAIVGSLADDIADIYRDLKKGLQLKEEHSCQPEQALWEWRFLFSTHWGKHAIDALQAIHSHYQNDAT